MELRNKIFSFKTKTYCYAVLFLYGAERFSRKVSWFLKKCLKLVKKKISTH